MKLRKGKYVSRYCCTECNHSQKEPYKPGLLTCERIEFCPGCGCKASNVIITPMISVREDVPWYNIFRWLKRTWFTLKQWEEYEEKEERLLKYEESWTTKQEKKPGSCGKCEKIVEENANVRVTDAVCK